MRTEPSTPFSSGTEYENFIYYFCERCKKGKRNEDGKILRWNDPRTAKDRSKTFPGIAKAMAEQWGGDITGGTDNAADRC